MVTDYRNLPGLPPPVPITGAYSEFDFFTKGVAPSVPGRRPQNTLTTRYVPARGNMPAYYDSLLTVRDLSGGLNCQEGEFGTFNNMLASSTLVTHYPGYAMLPFSIGASSSTSPVWANMRGLHFTNIFNTLALGIGDTANFSLFVGTTGAPSARTYSPGSGITGLHNIRIGGVTAAERLAVCMSGNAVNVLSDLASTPTSSGNMHANTSGCWGMQQVPINGDTILLYIGNSIKTLTAASALGDDPASPSSGALTSIPAGGKALGLTDAHGFARAAWLFPRANNTSGVLSASTFNLSDFFKLVTTNWEGTDPIEVDWPIMGRIYSACLWNRAIVGTDTKEVYSYKDGTAVNLGLFKERRLDFDIASSALSMRCVSLGSHGGSLFARIIAFADTVPTAEWVERYDPSTGAWSAVSEIKQTTGGTSDFYRVPILPYSVDGKTFHWGTHLQTTGDTFYRLPVPSLTENPMFSQTSVHGGNATYAYASSGTAITPAWSMGGLETMRSVVAEIAYMGNLGSGPFGSPSVALSVGRIGVYSDSSTPVQYVNRPYFTGAVSTTFSYPDPPYLRRRKFPQNATEFSHLQVKLTVTAQTSGKFDTPNGLPFAIRFLSFPDGAPKKPSEVLGAEWAK